MKIEVDDGQIVQAITKAMTERMHYALAEVMRDQSGELSKAVRHVVEKSVREVCADPGFMDEAKKSFRASLLEAVGGLGKKLASKLTASELELFKRTQA